MDDEQVKETELRAKKQGWAPMDEWRDDPDKWVDAETFLKRGDEILPIARERNRAMEDKLERLETLISETNRQLADSKHANKELAQFYQRSIDTQRERILTELKAKQREAVAEGDQQAFDQAEQQIAQVEKDAKTLSDGNRTDSPPPEDPNFTAWKTKNRWYGTDAELSLYAESMATWVANQKPHLRGQAGFFLAVENEVRKRFPEKFNTDKGGNGDGDGDQPAVPRVEGGGAAPKRKSGKKGYDQLTPEAKRQCDWFTEHDYTTREKYLQNAAPECFR